MKDDPQRSSIIRDLGSHLLLRRGRLEDADALADFNACVHSDDEDGQPNPGIRAWVDDLVTRPHPTCSAADFTIVENSSTGQIVSSLVLISQQWAYEDIPFGVGRPELVGTSPEYRNQGLVRAQFEVIHQWSHARGELLQAITGIPYYYRQFEYEMAVSLGGGRYGYRPQVPKLGEDETEPYQVRPATLEDIAFLDSVYKNGCKRSLVNCQRDETMWRYELDGRSEGNIQHKVLCVIESNHGEKVGLLAHNPKLYGSFLAASAFELVPGISWAAVTPSVIRYLYHTGAAYADQEDKSLDFAGFGFNLGRQHPVYDLLGKQLPHVNNPYAWYLRLPDIPKFLDAITSILERRLAESIFSGHTGELTTTFYRSGIKFIFSEGLVKQVTPWDPVPHGYSGDSAFPGLTFLQLVFGYRSLEELKYAYPDCYTNSDTKAALLQTLFPKKESNIWPVS